MDPKSTTNLQSIHQTSLTDLHICICDFLPANLTSQTNIRANASATTTVHSDKIAALLKRPAPVPTLPAAAIAALEEVSEGLEEVSAAGLPAVPVTSSQKLDH